MGGRASRLSDALRRGKAERPGEPANDLRATEYVAGCFQAVQRAWANRDVVALRPFVTARLAGVLEAHFDELERGFAANRVEELALREVAVAAGAHGGERAAVTFTARDWLEDLRTGEPLEGDPDIALRFRQGVAAGARSQRGLADRRGRGRRQRGGRAVRRGAQPQQSRSVVPAVSPDGDLVLQPPETGSACGRDH